MNGMENFRVAHYTNISQFKIIDQDRKQVSREARDAIHIGRNNPALNHNIGKLNIPKISNQMLGIIHNTSTDVYTNFNSQQNPYFSHSNRATMTTNLQLINTSLTITTSRFNLNFSTPPLHVHPLTHIKILLKIF